MTTNIGDNMTSGKGVENPETSNNLTVTAEELSDDVSTVRGTVGNARRATSLAKKVSQSGIITTASKLLGPIGIAIWLVQGLVEGWSKLEAFADRTRRNSFAEGYAVAWSLLKADTSFADLSRRTKGTEQSDKLDNAFKDGVREARKKWQELRDVTKPLDDPTLAKKIFAQVYLSVSQDTRKFDIELVFGAILEDKANEGKVGN